MVKYHGFVTFVLPFYIFFLRFVISPTDRNYGTIRTFYGSNDVFCFVHVPSRGLKPSDSLLGGLRPKKYQHFEPVLDFADLQRKQLQYQSPRESTTLKRQPEVYFSRWLPPPSCISNNCYHFLTIEPISTKFCWNVANLTQNTTNMSKPHIYQHSRWRLPPS